MHPMDPTLGAVLVSREDIQQRVDELGRRISQDYAGKTITIVAILKGSFIFLADLVRQLDPGIPIEVDFMSISSYGNSRTSSGIVHIEKDIEVSIEGKDVIIVEDIVDSGLTLQNVHEILSGRGARSLRVAALLEKPGNSRYKGPLDYIGFRIEHQYVVGYGLDSAQKFRNLRDIRVLNEI